MARLSSAQIKLGRRYCAAVVFAVPVDPWYRITDFAAVSQGLQMSASKTPALKLSRKHAHKMTCTCMYSPCSVISSLGAGSAAGRVSSKEERGAKSRKILCIWTDFTLLKPECHYFSAFSLVLLYNTHHFLKFRNTSFTLVLIPSKRDNHCDCWKGVGRGRSRELPWGLL